MSGTRLHRNLVVLQVLDDREVMPLSIIYGRAVRVLVAHKSLEPVLNLVGAEWGPCSFGSLSQSRQKVAPRSMKLFVIRIEGVLGRTAALAFCGDLVIDNSQHDSAVVACPHVRTYGRCGRKVGDIKLAEGIQCLAKPWPEKRQGRGLRLTEFRKCYDPTRYLLCQIRPLPRRSRCVFDEVSAIRSPLGLLKAPGREDGPAGDADLHDGKYGFGDLVIKPSVQNRHNDREDHARRIKRGKNYGTVFRQHRSLTAQLAVGV